MSAMQRPFEVRPTPTSFTYDDAVTALGDLTNRSELSETFGLTDDAITGLVYAQTFHPVDQTPLRVYPMSQLEIIGDYPRVSGPVTDLWLNTVLPEVANRQSVNGIVLFMFRRDLGFGGRSIIELVREERRYRTGADVARTVLLEELARNK